MDYPVIAVWSAFLITASAFLFLPSNKSKVSVDG